MNWYKKAQEQNNNLNLSPEEIENSINMKEVGIKGLGGEVKKYPTFEEFENAWLRQSKHGLYWHITYDPNFQIDPTKGPQDMSSIANGKMDSGALMITSHLEYWAEGYMDEELTGGKPREYAAIIDMSNVPKEAYSQVSRGFDNEFYVSDPSQAKVIKVLPIKEALMLDQIYDTHKPQSQQELQEFYKNNYELV